MKEIQREHVEAFLFSLPDDQTFDYSCCNECFIAAFLKTVSRIKPSVSAFEYRFYQSGGWGGMTAYYPIPDWLLQLLVQVRTRDEYGRTNLISARELKAVYLELFPDTELFPEIFIASESHQPEGRVKG